MDPNVSCLRRSALAAVRTDSGEKTYFQDYEGHVRETVYTYGVGYTGGDKASIIAAADDTKYYGPLAAISTRDPEKAVALFYISKSNTLRGIPFSSLTSTWAATSSLSALNIPTAPASQLAVTGDFGAKASEIRLFYQDPTLTLRELAFDGHKWTYVKAFFDIKGIVGTSLASEKWMNDDGTLREIQFFYQDPTGEVRSHFYLAKGDVWDYGYLHLPARPPQCGLAVSAHRHLGYGADVCRVYVVDQGGTDRSGGVVTGNNNNPPNPSAIQPTSTPTITASTITEHAFYSDTEEWKVERLSATLLQESKVAACWGPVAGNPEIRLFYQGPGGGIEGYNFQGRRWWLEHGVPCGGGGGGEESVRAKL